MPRVEVLERRQLLAAEVTFYTFDEGSGTTAADSATSGVPDTATLTNGATWDSNGVSNSAVSFDGTNDLVTIPDSTDFNDRDVTATTIAFWFKADNVSSTSKQVLFKQSGQSHGLNAYLVLNQAKLD
ncbi:MAG: hypothetical protein AAGD07_17800 [Planctomycetota bacterium]